MNSMVPASLLRPVARPNGVKTPTHSRHTENSTLVHVPHPKAKTAPKLLPPNIVFSRHPLSCCFGPLRLYTHVSIDTRLEIDIFFIADRRRYVSRPLITTTCPSDGTFVRNAPVLAS